MDNLMKIWCGFSRSNHCWAIGSKVIAASEKRNYSHAYIRYQCPITGELMIFQASHGFVNCFHITNFLTDNIIVKEYELECTEDQFKEFYTFKCKSLGKKYSTKQILWFTLKKLFNVRQWSKNIYNCIKNGQSEYICSEIASIVCSIVGIKIDNTQLDQISPSDLDKILKERR